MSELVYGCMGLGGDWDGEEVTVDAVDAAERAVLAALDAGMTTFDHADIYRRGKAERAFGRVLQRHPGLRDRIRIQTKVGITLPTDDVVGHYDLSGEAIRTRARACLERLGVDHVDTLLLHRPDPLMEPQDAADALQELVGEGLVGAVGVSNFSAAQMRSLQRHLDLPLAVNQLELSLHHRGFVEEGICVNTAASTSAPFPEGTLEHCREQGVQVQAWGSLAQGRYSGRLPDDAEGADRRTARLVARLAEELGATREEVVLGWLMKHPARIAPVVGSTDPDRIVACAGAQRVAASMSREQWYALLTSARGAGVP